MSVIQSANIAAAPPMTSSTPPKRRVRRLLLGAAVFVLLANIAVVGWMGYAGLLGDNLRTIVPGKCFRSGTMPAAHLSETIRQEKIRTVLNLRGEHKNAKWYQDEAKACADAGVKLESVDLKLGELPSPENVKKVIETIETGAYPMIWHCHNGSDRAGLASTLYLMVAEKKPLEDALAAQLTWRYGHINWGKASSIDHFFDLYRQHGNGEDIKTWVVQKYPEIYAKEHK